MAATQYFKDSVKKNDLLGVRIMMKDSLLRDPTFKEFEQMESIAKHMDDLYQYHDGREFNTNRDEWDDEYLAKEQARLITNFSHERVDHIKDIITYLYPSDHPDRIVQTNIIKKLQSIEKHRHHTDEMLTKQLNALTKVNDEYQKVDVTTLEKDDNAFFDETRYYQKTLDEQRKAISAMKDVMQLLSMMDRYIDHTFGKYKDYADADKNGGV